VPLCFFILFWLKLVAAFLMDKPQNPTFNVQLVRGVILAFSSGILMGLATAPLNLFPLAWIALVPLWLLVLDRSTCKTQSANPKAKERRFWLLNFEFLFALCWGIGYHGFSLFWITGLHPLTWLGMPWIASIAIALFCWLVITLWGATFVVIWGWAMIKLLGREEGKSRTVFSLQCSVYPAESRLRVHIPQLSTPIPLTPHTLPLWTRLLMGTALWCGLEWLWSLTPLWWTSLGLTQSPGNLAILHLGQFSGPATVTAAIVAFNGGLAEVWIKCRKQQTGNRNQVLKVLMLPVACLIGLHLIGFGLYNQPLLQSEDMAVQIGIIQGNVPTRIKLTTGGIRRAESLYASGYETLVKQGAEVILTPEGALPYLWNERNQRDSAFYQAVMQKGVMAWLGTFTLQDGGIARSLLTITGDGTIVSRYNKIKLVPLGEYIPLRNLLGRLIGLLSPIELDGTAGTLNQQLDTPVGRAIASICYDSAFPQVFQAQAARGGEFILTASNLDPYSEVLMAQHQAQDLMRAIETDRWAARATNTGYSSLIDPHGQVIWRSQPHLYQIHTGTLYRRQTKTLYVRWGDWLTPLLSGLAIVSLVYFGGIGAEPSTPRPHEP
jgi:apolipoprotein N-acyltransferase